MADRQRSSFSVAYYFGMSPIGNNLFSSRTGRPSAVEDADIEYISNLLEANPVLYLDELQSRLLSVRNIIRLSIATKVSRPKSR